MGQNLYALVSIQSLECSLSIGTRQGHAQRTDKGRFPPVCYHAIQLFLGEIKMNSNLKRFALLMVLMWLSSSVLLLAGPHTMILENSDNNQTIDGPNQVMEVSETDLDRVDWSANHVPNPGFELWQNPHQLDDYWSSSDRTTEHFGWYASSPWPVNEGTRSLGIQARAIDYDHPSEFRITKTQWMSWSNPTNLSLKLDYYIDENPNPATDFDHFVIHLELGAPGDRDMWYYLTGGETKTNQSANVYFMLDSPVDTWNTFDRNITEDFFDYYGFYPTTFILMEFFLVSRTNDYIRVFLDDVYLVNSTYVQMGGLVGWGNFETGGTGSSYWNWYNQDPADISQSTLRRTGDWSLNMTALSNGNRSNCKVSKSYDVRLTELNPDRLSFWWRIEDLQESKDETYAYLEVECENDTGDSFPVWYWLTYGGGESAPIDYDGYQMIDVDGFNTTGSWQFFNRSIFEDITAVNQTQELIVENVELHVFVRQGGRLSVLFDDLSFVSAALNDMGYEDQLDVGTPIRAWGYDSPSFLVTDQAFSGEKAANLTIVDGDSYQESQRFASMPLTEDTETFLDINWRLEDFSGLDGELVGVEVYLDEGLAFAYIFANGSDPAAANGFDEYIILPEANTEGSWFNMQRCLSKDYETLFGSAPDTSIVYIYLLAESETGGRIEILFDDFYLYQDPAPDVHGVMHSPYQPGVGAVVRVAAIVIDPSLDIVTLHYRVNDGSWTNMEMSLLVDDVYNASIPGQSVDLAVEYYITAEDTFGKVTTALNGLDYFSYIVATTAIIDPIPPDASPWIGVIGSIIVAVVVGILVYIFIIRPKQEAT